MKQMYLLRYTRGDVKIRLRRPIKPSLVSDRYM